MITTLPDGLNPAPDLGNLKVSTSVKDASAPEFADAMQNLSAEGEPRSTTVVGEDSLSPAVSQEDALTSGLCEAPYRNELQLAMDESTMNMVKSGQEIGSLMGESLRTSRSDNAAQSDAKVEPMVDKTPLSVAASALSKADTNLSSSRILDLPSKGPVNESQQFGNVMATHVRILKNQGGGEAKVNLHPAELGRMSISVTTDGNETRVAFVVETSQARQAVESAMPRLRDMLESAGLSLSDSDVSERRDQQADNNEGRSGTSKAEMTSLDDDSGIEAAVVSVSVDPDRLIDIYT